MKQVICPSCGAGSYRDDEFNGDKRCYRCFGDTLKGLKRRELRMLAKDHAIVGYRWLGKRGLIRSLTGRKPWYGTKLLPGSSWPDGVITGPVGNRNDIGAYEYPIWGAP